MEQLRPKDERELKFKLNYLEENLVLDHPQVRQMLEGVMSENKSAVGIMFKNEGKIQGFHQGIKMITDFFLSELPYDRLMYYRDIPITEWDFLTEDKKFMLNNLSELYEKYSIGYMEDKADLIILRKTMLYFIQNKLESVNKYVDVTDILYTLTDEYAYEDTLVNNGFSPILNEYGFPRMDRLIVDKSRLVIVPIDESAPWYDPRIGSDGQLIPATDF